MVIHIKEPDGEVSPVSVCQGGRHKTAIVPVTHRDINLGTSSVRLEHNSALIMTDNAAIYYQIPLNSHQAFFMRRRVLFKFTWYHNKIIVKKCHNFLPKRQFPRYYQESLSDISVHCFL